MKNTRILLSILLLYCMHNASAQKLYYFIDTKDSLIGVKDDKGRVIIAPKGTRFFNYDLMNPINDSMILIPDFTDADTGTAISFGKMYDRQGNLLYHPKAFDNGPDYFVEGYARFIENRKTGFVNDQGKIVIPAQWDWISPFNYGYAFGCNGCYLDRSKDPEQPPIAFNSDAEIVYINRKGEKVVLMDERQSEFDLGLDGGYLPYPFRYTKEEQLLVDSFNNWNLLSKIANANVMSGNQEIRFEILDRPRVGFPFYSIQGYWCPDFYREDKMLFYVSSKREIFHASYFTGEKEPLNEWLKEELKAFQEFFKTHPDALNKFDTECYLKQLK